MAFETSTLVNGEWTTRTLDVDTVLRHYDQKDKEATTTFMEVETAPTMGILTQTVIRSPLVHWILPVKLRDVETQHVAFIGDEFVQIKELRPDGHLWDVLRKENFGARIRNARVVGSVKAYEEDMKTGATQVKDEDDDVSMDNDEVQLKAQPLERSALPPQLILLQLHTGDSVFLRLRHLENGKLAFVSSRHRVTKPMLTIQPGIHLAVDPSSRYMAIGCSERLFTIYALHSRDQLKEQSSKGLELRHVESESVVSLNGLIQKMEFLYPSPDDEGHIILLVLVIIKGKTRMLLYEWETGSDLKNIRPHSIKGHLLEKSRQIPLLLIPLTLKSSFILVCEDSMAVCQGILQGSPTFIDFNNRIDEPTELHHGSGRPLWTAWTRPPRLPGYAEFRDDIYIAREDGLIKFLEIDSREDEFVKAHNNIGEFRANCGTALACLDFEVQHNISGDLLVTGGDSCPGGTYLNEARKIPTLTQPIPNWSPAHDFATMSYEKGRKYLANGEIRSDKNALTKPDRLFACVGKGIKSSIIEFRYGLEGKLGLEMDYEIPIMQAWVLPQESYGLEEECGSIFLLSLGDNSAALLLSSDASDIVDLGVTSTRLDLRFRTIAAATQEKYTIQVTERSIVVIDGPHCHVYEPKELFYLDPEQEAPPSLDPVIQDAAISEDVVIYTIYHAGCTYIQVLCPEIEINDIMQVDYSETSRARSNVRTIAKISCHVTSLAIGQVVAGPFAVIAGWDDESIILCFQPIYTAVQRTLRIPYSFGDNQIPLESIASIATASLPSGNFLLLCGTRNGRVLTLEICGSTFEIILSRCDRIGATTALLSKGEYSHSGDLFFVSCDSKVCALTINTFDASAPGSERCLRSLHINQLWLTDALKPDLQQPRITSIAKLPRNGLSSADINLLLIAGSQLLLAELSIQPKAVPRQMSIAGTPTRLLYSHTLEVLIVAASINGRSTLLFIDPDTGADLSQPVDQKTKEAVEFVSGLGNINERVFRLFEWPYTKDGKTWNFIIVSTDTGRLLIISVADQERVREDIQRASYQRIEGTDHTRSKIAYYTRHKFKCAEPVYSVTGFPDGLLWCAGENLFCDVLDLAEKRFKRAAQYQLPSPAIDLSYATHGAIYALTQAHSLEVLCLAPVIGGLRIVRTYGDPLSRASLHHAMINMPLADRPIHLVSDKLCSIVGLWPTENAKADTLVTLFEAELSYSVLRFRAADCRPVWDDVWVSKGLNSNVNDSSKTSIEVQGLRKRSEILGLSITGVLSHYTFLDFRAWQFLRFLINLAIRSPLLCEFTYQDDPVPLELAVEPKLMMHVDGDILKRCLEARSLENLLQVGQDTVDARKIFETFCELLQGAYYGKLEKNAAVATYVDQAYAFLELYLRPVL